MKENLRSAKYVIKKLISASAIFVIPVVKTVTVELVNLNIAEGVVELLIKVINA